MDSFEVNKIIAAVLLVALLVIGIGKISDLVFFIEKPEKAGYKVELPDTENSSQSAKAAEVEEVDISALLALGTVEHGEKVFKKCTACHVVNKGGANKIGPALYNVIGRKAGSLTDYKYSKGMVAYAKEWTPQEMDGFLENPKGWVKGTKMAYAGIKDSKERAALILFLNQNGDDPLPLK